MVVTGNTGTTTGQRATCVTMCNNAAIVVADTGNISLYCWNLSLLQIFPRGRALYSHFSPLKALIHFSWRSLGVPKAGKGSRGGREGGVRGKREGVQASDYLGGVGLGRGGGAQLLLWVPWVKVSTWLAGYLLVLALLIDPWGQFRQLDMS
jgi:hypothetical protein